MREREKVQGEEVHRELEEFEDEFEDDFEEEDFEDVQEQQRQQQQKEQQPEDDYAEEFDSASVASYMYHVKARQQRLQRFREAGRQLMTALRTSAVRIVRLVEHRMSKRSMNTTNSRTSQARLAWTV